MTGEPIPHYDLYGEPPGRPEKDFLHVEVLEERSRPSDWKIRPHRHGDLHQIFLVVEGAGRISLDGETSELAAPFLVLAPAGTVHAFTWPAGSEGYVLTVSDNRLRAAIAGHDALDGLFDQGFSAALDRRGGAASGLAQALGQCLDALVRNDAFSRAAVAARLLLVLVETARLKRDARDAGLVSPRPEARLAARFRDLVESRFRQSVTIAELAGELGASEKQLRLACRRAGGHTPLGHLRARRLLEARRLLTYSAMTVSEIAYSLGFDDPAYFSRFFSSQVGESPVEFRAAARRIEEV
jgi:AraC family transcriptional activator of pobA